MRIDWLVVHGLSSDLNSVSNGLTSGWNHLVHKVMTLMIKKRSDKEINPLSYTVIDYAVLSIKDELDKLIELYKKLDEYSEDYPVEYFIHLEPMTKAHDILKFELEGIRDAIKGERDGFSILTAIMYVSAEIGDIVKNIHVLQHDIVMSFT